MTRRTLLQRIISAMACTVLARTPLAGAYCKEDKVIGWTAEQLADVILSAHSQLTNISFRGMDLHK